MLFDDLMKMEMPVDLRAGIEELLEIKKRSGESQRGKRIPVIQEFIEQELERQKAAASALGDDRMDGWEELNHVFLETLEMLD